MGLITVLKKAPKKKENTQNLQETDNFSSDFQNSQATFTNPWANFFSVWVTAGSVQSSLVDSTQLSNTPELIWVYCERIGITPGLMELFFWF